MFIYIFFHKLFQDYELKYEKNCEVAIKTLQLYAEKHNGRIIQPYLGPENYEKIVNGSHPGPIITMEDDQYIVMVENNSFEIVNSVEEAFFIWMTLHMILNIKFAGTCETKLKSFLKKYY